jgi:uncharacterized membrane protein YtjA (UPF0391 family)
MGQPHAGTFHPKRALLHRMPPAPYAVSLNASSTEVKTMLKWALIFLVISVVAGLFGFTGISAAAGGIARILFFIAIVIFLIFVVLAMLGIGAVT